MLQDIEAPAQAQSNKPTVLAMCNRAAVAVVFLAILALPIIWFGRASFAPAPLHENRILEPWPDFSIHTLQKLERWFSDRYGMRDALVYYGSRLQLARTGSPTNQDVVVGPAKWLFYDQYYVPGQPHFADLLGRDPMSESQVSAITENLANAQRALTACNIPFYFIVAPDKQTIYPEKLGVHVSQGTVTGVDQVVRALRERVPTLKVIDLRAPVRAAKVSAPYEMYKRTDTHWNSLGAFYGYRAIVTRFAADGVLPAAPWAKLAAWNVTQIPFDQGDIAVSLLSLPGYFQDFDTRFEKLTPRLASWVERPADATDQPGEGAFSRNPSGHGRLLMYRDSFAGELGPFLAEDFQEMWGYLGRGIDGKEIRRRRPSVVVLQIVERNVRTLKNNSFVNLDQVCR